MPKILAVLADSTAISANACASGLMLMAQSAKTNFCPSICGGIMTNAPLVRLTPGFVLIICKAGRTVSPVEYTAPQTSASACSICTNIVPKYALSNKIVRACSSVALPLRTLTNSSTIASNSS